MKKSSRQKCRENARSWRVWGKISANYRCLEADPEKFVVCSESHCEKKHFFPFKWWIKNIRQVTHSCFVHLKVGEYAIGIRWVGMFFHRWNFEMEKNNSLATPFVWWGKNRAMRWFLRWELYMIMKTMIRLFRSSWSVVSLPKETPGWIWRKQPPLDGVHMIKSTPKIARFRNPWWFRVSSIFWGLFQVMKWQKPCWKVILWLADVAGHCVWRFDTQQFTWRFHWRFWTAEGIWVLTMLRCWPSWHCRFCWTLADLDAGIHDTSSESALNVHFWTRFFFFKRCV